MCVCVSVSEGVCECVCERERESHAREDVMVCNMSSVYIGHDFLAAIAFSF